MKITTLTGQALVIPGNDIDTDRIIPARFLTILSFENMGEYLFYDERFNADGSLTPFPLNSPDHLDATILVVGANFGCGSSREHAAQAIMRYGFKAIIGISFSDIFSGNCQAIGLPCIPVSRFDMDSIVARALDHNAQLSIDLVTQTIQAGTQTWPSQLSPASQQAFISGEWHIKGVLKANADKTRAVANKLPYMRNFKP